MVSAEPEVITAPDDAPTPLPIDEEPATSVVVALTRVMRDLPGIGKTDRASDDQGGYAYRGIESITRHAQQLFARHGLVLVPRIETWERDEVLVGSSKKVWHDERCKIMYQVLHGPSGTSLDVGPFWAIGRDGSDKGVNKCMTQALKYCLLQLLLVGDKADDADGTTHEQERDAPSDDPKVDPLELEEIKARLTRIGTALHGYPTAWTESGLPGLANLGMLLQRELPQARRILDATEQAYELNGDVLPPLGEVTPPRKTEAGGPDAAGDGEVAAATSGEGSTDASRVATQADGETPAPPAEDLSVLDDDELRSRVIAAGGETAVLAPLIDEALARDLDISPPTLEAWQAAQSALDENDDVEDPLDFGGDYG